MKLVPILATALLVISNLCEASSRRRRDKKKTRNQVISQRAPTTDFIVKKLNVAKYFIESEDEPKRSRKEKNWPRYHSNGPAARRDEPKQLAQGVLNKWSLFRFGPANSLVPRQFSISVKRGRKLVLRVVDLGCIGDVFKIMATDGAKTWEIGMTEVVQPDDCVTMTQDANHAWNSGFWSRGEYEIRKPGNYRIMILPFISVNDGGTAALRFDYVDSRDDADTTDSSSTLSTTASTDDTTFTASSSDESFPSTDDSYPATESNDDSTSTGELIRRHRGPSTNTKNKYTKSSKAKSKARAKKAKAKKQQQKSRPSNSRKVCGTGRYYIVQTQAEYSQVQEVCADNYMKSARLTSDENLKLAVLETLKKCLQPRSAAWIGDYNGHDRSVALAVTLTNPDELNINEKRSSTLLPVLCQS